MITAVEFKKGFLKEEVEKCERIIDQKIKNAKIIKWDNAIHILVNRLTFTSEIKKEIENRYIIEGGWDKVSWRHLDLFYPSGALLERVTEITLYLRGEEI